MNRVRWRPFRFRTLRRKIVVITLALITASFAVVAFVTAFALHTFLNRRLDEQLVAAGNRFSISLEHPSDSDADNGADSARDRVPDTDPRQFQQVAGQAYGTLGARILDGRVTAAAVVGRNDTSSQLTGAARAVLATLGASTRPRELDIPGLGDYRVIVTRGEDGDLLVTGLPEHPVNETIARLLAIEAIVFGAALIVVGVADATFIRSALRPLDRVAATATAVAGLHLASGEVTLDERAPEAAEPNNEVGQVAAAVNDMLEQVESALMQRQASEDRLRHFLADASHELRTPIAVVRSHAEYARRAGGEAAGLMPEAVSQSLERIGSEAERMGNLVDDLLLLARLDSGRPLARDEVDLTRIVLDSVSDARVAGSDHRWQLILPEEPVTVIGDDHALRQVMSNLLANARTHTPAGTHVVTSVDADEDEVRVSVRDDGPGVPREVADRVFERFVRGDDARSSTTSNSGLGLSIVSAIVAAHKGTVGLDPAPGATTFSFTLPRC